jgi:hypothetical protein
MRATDQFLRVLFRATHVNEQQQTQQRQTMSRLWTSVAGDGEVRRGCPSQVDARIDREKQRISSKCGKNLPAGVY